MRHESPTDPLAGACPPLAGATGGEGEPRGDGAVGDGDLREALAAVIEVLAARFERVAGALKTLLAVHTDRAQLAIRKRIQLAILGVLGLLAGGTATVYATLVTIRGAADGVALAFGGRAWLGALVTGLGVLVLLGAGVGLVLRRWNRRELANQLEKYEKLRRERRPAGAS